ncbi:DUF3899 domain-containing protein [Paramaledivibacter caminithermalis]|jgi:membrane protein YdbS with pleckstrin-like domain|uniref:Uncharacterized protein n=1 Tax=Paramaledivibacter caminithermalis (strain DSM 15212 / CIP 107654 / DViRD3) TaxID=1121301 RepID=A0A1M6KRC0_PARC5|nr:DUF3899 domain-containing protein [Paramaledivibacter caminithermalis]SHJ61472.1 protein of unknown function [Paramaledivibacter caminithermalis DSM 15212]
MKILSLITIVFTLTYLIASKVSLLLFKLSNAFFILGITYLIIALIMHVKNVGLFKLIRYNNYKKKQKLLIEKGFEDKDSLMEPYEFFNKDNSNKWNNSIFYIFSIPLLCISVLLAFIGK